MRRQIDEAVTQALGVDPEWVATIRRELAREPSVTDRSVLGGLGLNGGELGTTPITFPKSGRHGRLLGVTISVRAPQGEVVERGTGQ